MGVVFKYPAAAACRAARIDKQRFNEAVAAGRYPCAPPVKKGGTRSFTEDDVIALFVYARLVEQDMGTRVAGEIACSLREKLNQEPTAEEIRIPRLVEESERSVIENTRGDASEHECQSVHIHIVFDVAGVRQEVISALKAFSKER